MPSLKREEYNAAYFGDCPAGGNHPAGYSQYDRGTRSDGSDQFSKLADFIHSRFDLNNKLVAELGCACGYLVADLRRLGAFASGIDWSKHCIEVRPDVSAVGHIHEEDARDYLAREGDESPFVDLLVSRFFLETFDSQDIPRLARRMNRKAKKQIHIFSLNPNPEWYLNYSLDWWAAQGFSPGTILGLWGWDRILEEVEAV